MTESAAKPTAVIRVSPDDFLVDELPAYEPSGSGEHLFVCLRKRDMTTPAAVAHVCRVLEVDLRSAGFAGLKDRRAVTTQTVSVPFPVARDLPSLDTLRTDTLEVLSVKRHIHKLKPGHLRGNRFAIVMRRLDPNTVPDVLRTLELAAKTGMPNAFGPQRFGRTGDNVERAMSWLSGKTAPPRDRRQLRLLFSAFQSHLFNELLARRVADGTWDRPLLGDLLKKHDSGGMFSCSDPTADTARAAEHELSPTGPIFGARMRWPTGRPAELEREVVDQVGGMALFDRNRALGEGTRRALRVLPTELRAARLLDDATAVRVDFVLPKGSYATTLLAGAVHFSQDTTFDEQEMVSE